MIGELLRYQPEIALFVSLAVGYFIGSFRVGPIQPGGVCGTSIVALLLGQTGARLDAGTAAGLLAGAATQSTACGCREVRMPMQHPVLSIANYPARA